MFQNVSFLSGDSVAIANSLWKDSTSLALKQTKNLFKEKEVVVGTCYFLSRHSKENYFLRSSGSEGHVYGCSARLMATKISKSQIPPVLWETLVNKIQEIVPFDPKAGISVKRALTDHFNELYGKSITARGTSDSSETFSSLIANQTSPNDILSTLLSARSFEIVNPWPPEKKAKLVDSLLGKSPFINKIKRWGFFYVLR